MQITIQKTTNAKKFLNIIFDVDPQNLSSEIRIALSDKEYQILFAAGVPLYKESPDTFIQNIPAIYPIWCYKKSRVYKT